MWHLAYRNFVLKFTTNGSIPCTSLLVSEPKLRIDLYGYTFITTVPATCGPKQTVWAKSQCRILNVILYNRTTSTRYTDMIPRCALIPLKPSFPRKVGPAEQSEAKQMHSIATEPKLHATRITILICEASLPNNPKLSANWTCRNIRVTYFCLISWISYHYSYSSYLNVNVINLLTVKMYAECVSLLITRLSKLR